MNPLVNALMDFLDAHDLRYLNQYNIELKVSRKQFKLFWIEIHNLRNTQIELCISYSGRNLQKLIRDFKLTRVEDVHSISPDLLWELFYKGICQLVCFAGDDLDAPMLMFHYRNERLVTIDDFDDISIPETNLRTVNDFLEYTIRYFEKHRDSHLSNN